MPAATDYLLFNPSAPDPKAVTGIGFTPDGTLPPMGAIACTNAQATAWQGSTIASGAIVPPVNAPPSLAQQAAAALAAGLEIALSGSMTLAATVFPTDPVTQAKLNAVSTVVLKTGAFPGGAADYPMKDAAGDWHTFTIGQYEAVATAIAAYVAPLDLIIDGNPLNATALPVSSVSLTV